MKELKFFCGNCEQPIEAPVSDAGFTMTCPTCAADVLVPAPPRPEIKPKIGLTPLPVNSPPPILKKEKASVTLENHADIVGTIAILLIIIGALIIFAYVSAPSIIGIYVGAGMISLSLFLFVIEQLIHIRALLSKD